MNIFTPPLPEPFLMWSRVLTSREIALLMKSKMLDEAKRLVKNP